LLIWWLLSDSNRGHKALQASALPTELKSQANQAILLEIAYLLKRGLLFNEFLGHKAFNAVDSVHELGGEDDGTVLFDGDFAEDLEVT
jgi:hypothetical protein